MEHLEENLESIKEEELSGIFITDGIPQPTPPCDPNDSVETVQKCQNTSGPITDSTMVDILTPVTVLKEESVLIKEELVDDDSVDSFSDNVATDMLTYEPVVKEECVTIKVELGESFSDKNATEFVDVVEMTEDPIKTVGVCYLTCDICGFKCLRKEGLTKHKKTTHRAVKQLNSGSTSDTVATEFIAVEITPDSKNENQGKTIGAAKLVCDVCGFKCIRKEGLTKHKRALHGAVKPLDKGSTLCETCNIVIKKKNILDHIEICGSKGLKNIDIESLSLTCNVCSKVFKYPSKMLRHKENAHNAVASFECTVCPFKTGSGDSFKRHITRHNTVIKCEKCDYTTNSSFNLQRHIKQHKKPIQCEICRKGVATGEALRKHLKIRHNLYASDLVTKHPSK
eukprot:GFUD01040531.1.p1 GENE.GFUD01040531.1~~GFUD01040531.1.p1  ORF type:complete len:397 (+),score=88.93 GFUD01040531.1:65-1255(+)